MVEGETDSSELPSDLRAYTNVIQFKCLNFVLGQDVRDKKEN